MLCFQVSRDPSVVTRRCVLPDRVIPWRIVVISQHYEHYKVVAWWKETLLQIFHIILSEMELRSILLLIVSLFGMGCALSLRQPARLTLAPGTWNNVTTTRGLVCLVWLWMWQDLAVHTRGTLTIDMTSTLLLQYLQPKATWRFDITCQTAWRTSWKCVFRLPYTPLKSLFWCIDALMYACIS